MWRMCSPRTRECQKPSGLRPEGCCHSISSWLGVRLHGKCQNVGTCVPLLTRGFELFASLQVRALGLNAPEGTHHERHAVDGLPIGNRYRRACLGRIGRFSETYNHLGLDPASRVCFVTCQAYRLQNEDLGAGVVWSKIAYNAS